MEIEKDVSQLVILQIRHPGPVHPFLPVKLLLRHTMGHVSRIDVFSRLGSDDVPIMRLVPHVQEFCLNNAR